MALADNRISLHDFHQTWIISAKFSSFQPVTSIYADFVQNTLEKDLYGPVAPRDCAPGQSCKCILHGIHH